VPSACTSIRLTSQETADGVSSIPIGGEHAHDLQHNAAKIKKFSPGRSACVAAGRWCRARTRLQWLLQDDLAGVEVPAGIHGGEQPIDHVHARRRDVLLQPGGMLSADCVVVRQRAA
jgi:hypothetical protein